MAMIKKFCFLRDVAKFNNNSWQQQIIRNIEYQLKKYVHINNPIFIILIPGSLHIIDLCLHYIPKSEKIILILNGMNDWEERWARENLHVSGIITIKSLLDHPVVLDILFKIFNRPFGIMDYDSFIIDKAAFGWFKCIKKNSLGNVFFHQRIDKLRINLPHTHAMFFNTIEIKKIMRKHKVNCRRIEYEFLSRRIKNRLSRIGINFNCLPEEDYNFDTMKLIILLGITEGKEFITLDTSDQPVALHIGCVSNNPKKMDSRWSRRASYFWQRALLANDDLFLKSSYQRIYIDLPSLAVLKENLENDGYTSPSFFAKVEKILAWSNVNLSNND